MDDDTLHNSDADATTAEMLDIESAAAALAVSQEQVRALARSGKLLHTLINQNLYFRQSDLDAYLTQRAAELKRSLPASNELFAKAFNANPHPMSISTLAEGRLLDVNESLLQLTGYEREELVGHTTFELHTYSRLEDRARLRKALTEEGRVRELEVEFLMKNGTARTGLVSAEIIEIDGERCILATVTDISARRAAERRFTAQHRVTRTLEESRTLVEAAPQLLRAICETSRWEMGALWEVDAQTDVLRAVAVWHVPAIEASEFAAYTQETPFPRGFGLPGRVWQSASPSWITNVAEDDNFQRSALAMREGLHGAVGFPILYGNEVLGMIEFFSHEIRPPNEDQIELMSNIGSQVGQFIERRRAEKALRESETRFRTLAETASDAIITIDETSTILFVNPKAESVFGYTAEEMTGASLTMLMPEYLRHLHRSGIGRYVETGERHLNWQAVEIPGLHKSGAEIPLELSFGEFSNNGRRFFTGIARDITERQRMATALQHRAEELAEANRMKDEFLATLSHELRTPLTAIIGWAHLLHTGNLNAETSLRAVESIQRNARSQAQLIEDLLDVSRIITGKINLEFRHLDLSTVLASAMDAVRPAATNKRIELVASNLDAVGPINGDAARLQQVVWNLLTNAIKFTPEGGHVEVRLERADTQAVLIISDSGIGISKEFLPYVFDRFRQADSTSTRAYGGLGLGLSLVRHLVELHNGTVRAESAGEGHGSTFKVGLPLLTVGVPSRQMAALKPGEACTGDGAGLLKGLRVLVVDDEADAREMLGVSLSQCGAEVSISATASQALEMLQLFKPDVLISDIGMVGEDGYTLIRNVRALSIERGGRTPAVALTAYAREDDRRRALAAGFQVHLSKPIDPQKLATAVATLAGN